MNALFLSQPIQQVFIQYIPSASRLHECSKIKDDLNRF